MRILSRRDHSEYELRQKLALYDALYADIDVVILYCFENNWLDDKRFAASLLRLGVSKGHGWQRICFDAQKKGIDKHLLEQAEQAKPHDWFELAKKLALKRFGDLDGHLPKAETKQRAKWFRYLQYRGFSFEQINYALSG